MATTTPLTTSEFKSELNKVRYSAADFNSFFDDILNRLQTKFSEDFNDLATSSLGIMLIDLVSFGLDSLSFYLDRRASDTYLSTARTQKTIARLARQLGYKIRGAVPASVDLTVSLTIAQAFGVTIPANFKFKTADGLIFESAQSTVYAIGDDVLDTKLIPCFQGTTVSDTFTSTGDVNQIFELTRVDNDSFVSFGSVVVLVNGSPYTEKDFLTYDSTDQYEISYGDSPPTLRFGDGIVGNIPPKGATITISYIVTKGKTGLVPVNTITDVVTTHVESGVPVRLTVNNLESSVGGDDAESLEHVKSFAGKVFKSRDVAVTEEDYESLAGSYADPVFGRVSVAKAISSKNSAADIELQNNIIIIKDAVEGPIPTVNSLVSEITTDLTSVLTETSSIQATVDLIQTDVVTIDGNLQSILNTSRSTKNASQEIIIDGTEIVSDSTNLVSTVNAVPEGVSDVLTSSTKSTLLNLLNRISGNASAIVTDTTLINANATTEVSVIGSSRDLISTTTANLTSIETDLTVVTSTIGVSSPTATGIFEDLVAINDTLIDESATVNSALSNIEAHVSTYLNSDCSANLVSVPILSVDNSGFYAAPSIGLIHSLQDFLETRKEVTQVVKVTSGASFLIPAVVTIRIGVLPGFSESVVATTANAVVEGVLRNRSFGRSLYVSDIICEIRDLAGVGFDNTKINGYLVGIATDTGKLDIDGNLIINETEVITKGTITITTEPIPFLQAQ